LRRAVGRNMDIVIRQAAEADLYTLAAFEADISRISFGDKAITDRDFHIKKLRNALEKNPGGMFVAESGNIITGWLWMDIRTNSITGEPYANFRSFYIAEGSRGGADGETLLKYGLEWCRCQNAGMVAGKVHASNLPMRALYKKAGFTATHITMEMRMQ